MTNRKKMTRLYRTLPTRSDWQYVDDYDDEGKLLEAMETLAKGTRYSFKTEQVWVYQEPADAL